MPVGPRPSSRLVAVDADARSDLRRRLLAWMPVPFRRLRLGSPELERIAGAEAVARVRVAFDEAAARSPRAALGGVVLQGMAGVAKTALACAWLGGVIDAGAERARFVPALALGEERDMADGRAVSWVDLAITAAPLVLDDLGAELSGAPEASGIAAMRLEAATRVIHARYDRGAPMVVTTPHDRSSLARAYGDGIARRVFEGAAVVRLGGVR